MFYRHEHETIRVFQVFRFGYTLVHIHVCVYVRLSYFKYGVFFLNPVNWISKKDPTKENGRKKKQKTRSEKTSRTWTTTATMALAERKRKIIESRSKEKYISVRLKRTSCCVHQSRTSRQYRMNKGNACETQQQQQQKTENEKERETESK